MGFYTRKIVLGLTISAVGVLLTFAWYKYDLSRSKYSNLGNKKVVAHLIRKKNEVQKKLTQRVVWLQVDDSDELHVGEAVRTANDAEAIIVFVSGTQIEMDPDSVVSIEDSGDQLNLNFLKGNLVVRGGKGSGMGLKAGNTDINLGGGEIALNKAQGQNLDLQVLQGTAEIKQGDKKVVLDRDRSGQVSDTGINVSEQLIKVRAPQAFSKVFVRADKNETVVFEWEPLTENFDIYLEVGKTRETLQRMQPRVSGRQGKLAVQLKPGALFWKLNAIDRQNPTKIASTPLSKMTVIAEVPPLLLTPAKNSVALLSQQTKTLNMQWTNPSNLERLKLEVSQDQEFSKILYSQSVEGVNVHEAPLKQEGIYFWRVVGYRPSTNISAVSDVQKFNLQTKVAFAAPEVKGPAVNERVSLDSIKSGQVYLAWNSIPGVNKYHVRIFRQEGQKVLPAFEGNVIDSAQFKFNQLKAGIYRWDVASISAEGKFSQTSPARTLNVEDLPLLSWQDERAFEEYQYVGSKPHLKVMYKSYPQAVSYKILYKASDGQQKDMIADMRLSSQLIELDKEGLYPVTIEALDANGKAIAKSKIKNYRVKQAPFLPPPEFSERVPAKLIAQKNGSVGFVIKPVKGAKNYLVNIKGASGKVEKTEKVLNQNVTLRNLMPGNYTLSLATVDSSGRVGPDGVEKNLVVPSVSDSRAPSFRKLRIK